MAKNETQHLRPVLLEADERTGMAIRGLRDYRPFDPAFSLDAFEAAHAEMQSTREAKVIARNALDAARDAAVAAQWDYHNGILAAKDHVVGQFGANSDQVAALGLKKKSERKAPVRKSKAAAS